RAVAERPAIAEVIGGQTRLFEARRATAEGRRGQLLKRQAQIADQIAGIDAQSEALDAQEALVAQDLADKTALLDRGLVQKPQVLAVQRDLADLRGRIGELRARRAQAEGQTTEIGLSILSLADERREQAITELREVRTAEAELAERRRALVSRLDRLELRAPVGGLVYDLGVFAERAVIRPAEPILYIVPQDRPLVIAARVEVTDRDLVFVGQRVTTRFAALDQRTTPELFGRVTQVSADAFVDEATGASFYRVETVLDEGEVSRLPEGTVLTPGMPVDSFIRTSARTPLAYLTKPLTDYFAKAFRQG
ncbi:MAG: HlyD family type I secretion periplasmic adaptor subunit, partial [Shimia sp.]